MGFLSGLFGDDKGQAGSAPVSSNQKDDVSSVPPASLPTEGEGIESMPAQTTEDMVPLPPPPAPPTPTSEEVSLDAPSAPRPVVDVTAPAEASSSEDAPLVFDLNTFRDEAPSTADEDGALNADGVNIPIRINPTIEGEGAEAEADNKPGEAPTLDAIRDELTKEDTEENKSNEAETPPASEETDNEPEKREVEQSEPEKDISMEDSFSFSGQVREPEPKAEPDTVEELEEQTEDDLEKLLASKRADADSMRKRIEEKREQFRKEEEEMRQLEAKLSEVQDKQIPGLEMLKKEQEELKRNLEELSAREKKIREEILNASKPVDEKIEEKEEAPAPFGQNE